MQLKVDCRDLDIVLSVPKVNSVDAVMEPDTVNPDIAGIPHS